MAPKRKLSSLDSSPSAASTSSTDSRSSLSPSPPQHAFTFRLQAHTTAQFPSPAFAWLRDQDSRHASGRTRKRFRDGRPDEQVIYANTFRKLFDAQRSNPNQQSQMVDGHVPPDSFPDAMDTSDGDGALEGNANMNTQVDAAPQPKSQASLHKFFNISRAPTSNAMPPTTKLGFDAPSTKCQDCEASLEGGEDVMMDEGYGGCESRCGCRRCGRMVCDLCAVVDFGEGSAWCAGRVDDVMRDY